MRRTRSHRSTRRGPPDGTRLPPSQSPSGYATTPLESATTTRRPGRGRPMCGLPRGRTNGTRTTSRTVPPPSRIRYRTRRRRTHRSSRPWHPSRMGSDGLPGSVPPRPLGGRGRPRCPWRRSPRPAQPFRRGIRSQARCPRSDQALADPVGTECSTQMTPPRSTTISESTTFDLCDPRRVRNRFV